MSVTKSASPRPATSSNKLPQIWATRASSSPIIRGVKPRLTNPRSLVRCGGSMLSIITASRSTAASGRSRKFAVRRAEERISGCRDR
jgi:hypothetical protein